MFNYITHKEKPNVRKMRYDFRVSSKSPIILDSYGVVIQFFRVNNSVICLLELMHGNYIKMTSTRYNLSPYTMLYIKDYLKQKGFKIC